MQTALVERALESTDDALAQLELINRKLQELRAKSYALPERSCYLRWLRLSKEVSTLQDKIVAATRFWSYTFEH